MEKEHNHEEKKVTDNQGAPALTFASTVRGSPAKSFELHANVIFSLLLFLTALLHELLLGVGTSNPWVIE